MKSFSIGVDLGGTNLRVASVTPAGELLDHVSLPTRLSAGPHAVLDDMAAAIRQLIDKPVSYTHLDVYKRQEQSISKVTWWAS